MNLFESNETLRVLDAVGENIFVANTNFEIVWINAYADELIKTIGPYIHIEKKEELYGRNINEFHPNDGERQEQILQNGPFPYRANINLFNQYRATIVVNPLERSGERIGYILSWHDVTKYEEELDRDKVLMEGMYTPIIELSVDGVLLIPITGVLTEDRIEKMKVKTLKTTAEKGSDYVLIDFTGMTEVGEEYVLTEINSLATALRMLGSEVIYTGLSVDLVKMMVKQGIKVNARTFNSFKQAMKYILSRINGTK